MNGFDAVFPVHFVRRPWPGKQPALFVDLDGTIRTRKVLTAPVNRITAPGLGPEIWTGDAIVGTSADDPERPFPLVPEEIEILPRRAEVLRSYKDKGYFIFAVTNQSAVHKGTYTAAEARGLAVITMEMAGFEHGQYTVLVCPHASGAPQCWCRKPMPGMAIWAYMTHDVDPTKSLMVGDLTSDKTFAQRAGLRYVDAEEFFA